MSGDQRSPAGATGISSGTTGATGDGTGPGGATGDGIVSIGTTRATGDGTGSSIATGSTGDTTRLPPPMPASPKISVENAIPAIPSLPSGTTATDFSEKDRAALYLAWGVLGLLGLFSGALICFASFNELFHQHPDIRHLQEILDNIAKIQSPTPEILKSAREIANDIKELRRASREFWTSLSQLFLLNLLIPVLTSILGYIFGSRK